MIFADDTMCTRAREINSLQSAIENYSNNLNLQFDYDELHIRFSNGSLLEEVTQANYLRGEINDQASRWSKLNDPINKESDTCNRLKTFWYETLLMQVGTTSGSAV